MSTHYIAKVVVERITTPDNAGTIRTGGATILSGEPKRTVATVASIIVPARDVDTLRAKVAGHMALVDDEGDIDSRSKGATRG